MLSRTQINYRIPIDEDFHEHLYETHKNFSKLAQDLHPLCENLSHSIDATQLQNLYYLLKKKILEIREERFQDGSSVLFLTIQGVIVKEWLS